MDLIMFTVSARILPQCVICLFFIKKLKYFKYRKKTTSYFDSSCVTDHKLYNAIYLQVCPADLPC